MPRVIFSSASKVKTEGSVDQRSYRALKTEQGVFTTPPYSGSIKPLWRFKDEASARESAAAIWERFESYR